VGGEKEITCHIDKKFPYVKFGGDARARIPFLLYARVAFHGFCFLWMIESCDKKSGRVAVSHDRASHR